jgi:hypothetical protein
VRPDVPRLDEYVADSFRNELQAVLVELKLPSSQAGHALRLLAHRFVSASSVFPGYEGSVRAIAERIFWDARAR